jgi:uncharacterized membrane protein
MSELFKSKVGMLLVSTYLLLVLSCLIYVYLIDKDNALPYIFLLILTAPWNFFLSTLLVQLGIVTGEIASHKNDDLLFIVKIVFSTLINAPILYLLGFLLTKAFSYLSSKKPKALARPLR